MESTRMLRTDFRSAMADLEDRILLLGRTAQQMVGTAMTALEATSPELCAGVVASDDALDQDAYALNEDLYALLTLQGPVATDLRLLLSLQKVLGSIERIGDRSLNIARLGADLAGIDDGSTDLRAQMHELGRRAERAARMGLDSFSHRRPDMAFVSTVEDQIDLLHDGLTGRLIDYASTGPSQTRWAMRMLLASHQLERIGDHAVTIAGEGAFVATGQRPPPRSRL